MQPEAKSQEGMEIVFRSSDLPRFAAILREETRKAQRTYAGGLIAFLAYAMIVLSLFPLSLIDKFVTAIAALPVVLLVIATKYLSIHQFRSAPVTVTRAVVVSGKLHVPLETVRNCTILKSKGVVELSYLGKRSQVRNLRFSREELVDPAHFVRVLAALGIQIIQV